jgi:hypothetical protein
MKRHGNVTVFFIHQIKLLWLLLYSGTIKLQLTKVLRSLNNKNRSIGRMYILKPI